MKIFDIVPKSTPAEPHPSQPLEKEELGPERPQGEEVERETTPLTPSVARGNPQYRAPNSDDFVAPPQKPRESTPAARGPRESLTVPDVLAAPKERRPPLLEELRVRFRRRLLAPTWLVLGGIVVLGAIGVLTVLYPRVTVSIKTKKTDVPLEFFLTVDGKSDNLALAEGKIPGRFFSLTREASRSFPASGSQKRSAKARGTITAFNAFSAKPQTLVATTRFETPDKKIFRLITTTTIPGASVGDGKLKPSSVVVEVEADRPGPSYNIGPTDFTIPGFKGTAKFTGFYGKSSAPMTGGAEGVTVIVEEQDLANARKALREELEQNLLAELRQKLPAGWEFFPGALNSEIVSATPSVSPGRAAERFEVRLVLKVNTVAYRPDDLTTLAAERLKSVVSTPRVFTPRLETFTPEDVRLDDARQTLSALLKAVGKIEARLDEGEIKRAILGTREEALKRYLGSLDGVESAKVTFWPFWVKRVPARESLVTIAID